MALQDPTPVSKKAVSPGAIAGAVIAAVVFVAVIGLTFLWYRRRQRQAPIADDAKPDTPARAEEVLNRPDPHNEKSVPPIPQDVQTIRIYGGASNASTLR